MTICIWNTNLQRYENKLLITVNSSNFHFRWVKIKYTRRITTTPVISRISIHPMWETSPPLIIPMSQMSICFGMITLISTRSSTSPGTASLATRNPYFHATTSPMSSSSNTVVFPATNTTSFPATTSIVSPASESLPYHQIRWLLHHVPYRQNH